MKTIASSAATLFLFWLALSGMYTPFLLAAGACPSLAVALLAWRMEVADREGHPVHLTLAAAAYLPWLVKEILKSGWQVARIILDPRLPVSPALVRVRPSQQSTVGPATARTRSSTSAASSASEIMENISRSLRSGSPAGPSRRRAGRRPPRG